MLLYTFQIIKVMKPTISVSGDSKVELMWLRPLNNTLVSVILKSSIDG
jgi:hypothetical protein